MTALCWKRCCARRQTGLLLLPLLVRNFGSTSKLDQLKSRVNSLLPGQILVGPPHPISNIRPIAFYIPSDETAAEQKYRELREHAVARDHEFWLDNNTRFEQGKADFERHTTETKGACTLDDLSEYFKQYQVDSFDRHLQYNRYVWKRNLAMVWPGLCAWVGGIGKRKRRRTAALARHSEQSYFDHRRADLGAVVAERIQNNTDLATGSGCTPSQNKNLLPPQPKPAAESLDSDVDRRAEKIKSYY